MRNDRELLLDGIQELNSNVNTIVSSVSLLSFESHGPKWTSSLGALIKCTSRVPPTIIAQHIAMIKNKLQRHNGPRSPRLQRKRTKKAYISISTKLKMHVDVTSHINFWKYKYQ